VSAEPSARFLVGAHRLDQHGWQGEAVPRAWCAVDLREGGQWSRGSRLRRLPDRRRCCRRRASVSVSADEDKHPSTIAELAPRTGRDHDRACHREASWQTSDNLVHGSRIRRRERRGVCTRRNGLEYRARRHSKCHSPSPVRARAFAGRARIVEPRPGENSLGRASVPSPKEERSALAAEESPKKATTASAIACSPASLLPCLPAGRNRLAHDPESPRCCGLVPCSSGSHLRISALICVEFGSMPRGCSSNVGRSGCWG